MELVVDIVPASAEAAIPPEGGGVAAGAERIAASPNAVIPPELLSAASDDALVRAALAEQEGAFAELVRRYTRMVMWHVSSRVSANAEVEEIAQEAIVRSYVNLAKLRAPGAFSGWLMQIADSVVREKFRSESRVINLASPDESVAAPASAAPPEELSRSEIRSRIVIEMKRLPPRYRTTLALKYMKGLSVEEIAARLQVPAGTVRARLSRAYGMLRTRLESSAGTADSGPAGARPDIQEG